jgi:hypothetical protein
MDLAGIAAALTATVALVTGIVAIIRERSRIRILERLSKLRPRLVEESPAYFSLRELEDSLAQKLLSAHNVPGWARLLRLGVALLVIGVILLGAGASNLSYNFLYTLHISELAIYELRQGAQWVGWVLGILGVTSAVVSEVWKRFRLARAGAQPSQHAIIAGTAGDIETNSA